MFSYYCAMTVQDWNRWIVHCHRQVAYLGRYAPGLGVGSAGVPVESWPISKIHAYVKMTSRIIEIENKPSKSAGSSRT